MGLAGKEKRPCYIQSPQAGKRHSHASSGDIFRHAEITRRSAMGNKVNQERLASVLGRAVLDEKFASALHSDPAGAAKNIGVHLSTDEVAAVKGIDAAKLTAASSSIRNNLGIRAVFDTQNQQQQARMD
jgi:hypothetical protein